MDVDSLSTNNATLAFNGTGTTTVYGVIAGGSATGEAGNGLIDINTGTVSFKNTLGSESNYISSVNIASGSNMTTSSNIYANESIVVLGRLHIDTSSGITINAYDQNGNGGGYFKYCKCNLRN